MGFTTPQKTIFGLSLAYVAAFTVYYISIRNFEFLWYVVILLFFAWLIGSTLKTTKFPHGLLGGLSLWGLLHMAGGGIKVSGQVLYKFVIYPFIDKGGEFVILKFDQFVHFYGFFITTLVMLHLLKARLSPKVSWKFRAFVAASAGLGLSALNEIVEFIAVLAIPQTNVGGYFNTGFDLMFNLGGCLFAVIVDTLLRKN